LNIFARISSGVTDDGRSIHTYASMRPYLSRSSTSTSSHTAVPFGSRRFAYADASSP
jgi:hypothetical protein